MIRRSKILIALSAVFFCGQFAYGQFEGKVLYKVNYKSEDPAISGFMNMLPNESSLLVKGTQSRFEQNVMGGGKQIFVNNSSDQSSTLVLNYFGEEFKVNFKREDLEMMEKAQSVKIVETQEEKEILGIKCKKAVAFMGSDTLSVYYNESMYTGTMLPQFSAINGLALEYEIVHNGLYMHFEAMEIQASNVPLESFEISGAIREVPFSDFAKSFAAQK